MSQILRDLNKLAKKVGAPVVGQNISEQIRALNTFWEASSHGANIAERINETAHSKIDEGGSPAVLIEKSVTANDVYNAADDNADGYSKVTVNVPSSSPTLIEKSVTANGVYSASSDSADGYSKVTVNVQPEFYATPAAFTFRMNLKDFEAAVPSGVTSLADGAFYTCKHLKKVTLPDTVTSVGNNAFKDCTDLIEAVIDDAVTSIGSNAFENCTSLQKVKLPPKIGYFQNYLFKGCSSLKSLDLPNQSTGNSINAYAFAGLTSLEWIKFKRTIAVNATSSSFSDFPSTAKVLVPLGSYGSYTTKQYYPSPSTNLYLCYATYESGAFLPTASSDNYNLTWYASIADAAAETNPITTGNGEEVYARCTAQ